MSPETDRVRAALCGAGPAVRRYLFGLCGNWHEAEDLAQDALLKAWRHRARFDGRADAQTWIFRIARNHWIDLLRRRRIRPKEQSMTQTHAYRKTSVRPHPPAEAERGELADALRKAMAKLPAEQREALALRESDAMTFPQIAAMLGVPVATVKSRVRYALIKLADEMKPYEAEWA